MQPFLGALVHCLTGNLRALAGSETQDLPTPLELVNPPESFPYPWPSDQAVTNTPETSAKDWCIGVLTHQAADYSAAASGASVSALAARLETVR